MQRNRRRVIYLAVDIIQAAIGLIAVVTLALDFYGFITLPVFQNNLAQLTFGAIAALIIIIAIERRVVLASFEQKVEDRFDNVDKQLQIVKSSTSEFVSADLLFKNRIQFAPLEDRLQNAKEVSIYGKSLVGLVTQYFTLFLKLGKQGYKFRFLLVDPSLDPTEALNVEQSLMRLKGIQDEIPSQIEIRLSPEILYCSVFMIDGKKRSGKIQVEFYNYKVATSDRPHITLSATQDPKWYKFYYEQFETLWKDAKQCEFSNSSDE